MVANVPHSSILIPPEYAQEILLSKEELQEELFISTDFDTDKMLEASPGLKLHIAEVSRLVCDTERFFDDSLEAMAAVGRGVVYKKTSEGKSLRNLTDAQRDEIIGRYYLPYHTGLTEKVAAELEEKDRALVIDLHSFHHENTTDPIAAREVEVCIGTDDFHTPGTLLELVRTHIESCGYRVAMNIPFSGTIVPMKFYQVDKRVSSIMLEINRSVYFADAEKMNRLKEMLGGLVDRLNAAGW